MPANSIFLDRVQRKFLPSVQVDPDSCPCRNERLTSPPSSEENSVGKGNAKTDSAGSCQSLNKLATDDIEISVHLDRIFGIFCRTLEKLELSASLHVLLEHPELRHILTREDFRVVMDAFNQYIQIEPCSWRMLFYTLYNSDFYVTVEEKISVVSHPNDSACSESAENLDSWEVDSKRTVGSSINLDELNPDIYRAIEILNGCTEVRELVKQLRPDYSEQAQLCLGYMKYFFEHSLKRVCMSPEESRAKTLRYRNFWRDNEKAKLNLQTLTKVLDEQRKKHNAEMEFINLQCEKDLATVKRVNRKCKEDIKYTVIRSERDMMMMYKASEMKQKEMREDVANTESHLKATRALNLAMEKEARNKRFKVESQLLGIINKYDTEIGEKQKQMELLIEQFEADKKQKEEFEAEIEKQSEIYDAFMKEKQRALDAIANEKLSKLMMLRAAKIIQRWWRKMLANHPPKAHKRKKKAKKTIKKKK